MDSLKALFTHAPHPTAPKIPVNNSETTSITEFDHSTRNDPEQFLRVLQTLPNSHT
jgi:hypothetical protein